MSCKVKRLASASLALALGLSLFGCAQSEEAASSVTMGQAVAATSAAASVSGDEMFTDADKEIGYDETASVITLADGASSCDDNAVSINGDTVTITGEGTFILTGTLSNGQVVVDAASTDKLRLVFSELTINCDTSAAIYIKQADKVFVTLAADTTNTLSNQSEFVAIDDNNIDAVIFSKDDLTLNGNGSLVINAAYGHGIVSKDDLVLTSGSYKINAASHALSGKDSVRIAAGSYTLTAGKDGLHAENADDTSLGFIYIAGGSFVIDAVGDGIDAAEYLQIEDGDFAIAAGGGSVNGETHTQSMMGGRMGVMGSDTTTTTEDTTSTKGIKAGGMLTINGGSFDIDTADDAVHSNADLSVAGGEFYVASGDDALHADNALQISSGSITVSQCYEGFEGLTVQVSGGTHSITASDDGVNAAGGNDQSGFGGFGSDVFGSGSGSIVISGGCLYINATGDGIDSNGSLTVTGGETYIDGPNDGANGALDYDSEAQISGGIFVAVGGNAMAMNFGSSSTQGALLISTGSAEGEILLTDASGSTLLDYTPSKAYGSVLISCPALTEGATYTVTAGGQSTNVEMTSLIYGAGGGFGGGHGGGGAANAPRDLLQDMPEGTPDDLPAQMPGDGQTGEPGRGGMGGMDKRDGTPPDHINPEAQESSQEQASI